MQAILAVNPHWVKHRFLPMYDSVIENGLQRAIPYRCPDCEDDLFDHSVDEIEFFLVCPFCKNPTDPDEGDLECSYGTHSSFYCNKCGAEGILEEDLECCHVIVDKPDLDKEDSNKVREEWFHPHCLLEDLKLQKCEIDQSQRQIIQEYLQGHSRYNKIFYPQKAELLDYYRVNLLYIEKANDLNVYLLDTDDQKRIASQDEVSEAIRILSETDKFDTTVAPPPGFIWSSNADESSSEEEDQNDNEIEQELGGPKPDKIIERIKRVGIEVKSYDLRTPQNPYPKGTDLNHGGSNIDLLCRNQKGEEIHVMLSGD